MVDIVKERVFNTLFDSMKEKVKGIKEKNEIKTLTLKYFNDYFKDIDFTEEFDYESVTEYLLEMYESIYKSATPQDTIDGIISGCVARGNSDFSNANLDYSCLKNARLENAKFIGTQLRGTDLPNGQFSMDQSEQTESLRNMNIMGLVL